MFSYRGIRQEREINTILKHITEIVGMDRITSSIISNLNKIHIAETGSENLIQSSDLKQQSKHMLRAHVCKETFSTRGMWHEKANRYNPIA
jgi:hypothetical protein